MELCCWAGKIETLYLLLHGTEGRDRYCTKSRDAKIVIEIKSVFFP